MFCNEIFVAFSGNLKLKSILINVGFEQVSYKNQCMPNLKVDWAGPIPRPGTQADPRRNSVARSQWPELTKIFQNLKSFLSSKWGKIWLKLQNHLFAKFFFSLTYWIIFHVHFKITRFSFCLLQWYYLVSSIPGFDISYFLSSKDQVITTWCLIQCRKKQNWRKKG